MKGLIPFDRAIKTNDRNNVPNPETVTAADIEN